MLPLAEEIGMLENGFWEMIDRLQDKSYYDMTYEEPDIGLKTWRKIKLAADLAIQMYEERNKQVVAAMPGICEDLRNLRESRNP